MICWMEQRRRAARRKRLARIALGLVVFSTLVLIGGSLLPSERRGTLQASFERPPEAVFRILMDFDGMPLWRSGLSRVERLPDASGRTVWREFGRDGDVIVELVESEPPHRLVTRQVRSGRESLPELTFRLIPSGSGTSLLLIEREDVSDPLGRILARLGARTSPAARLLRDLENRLNVHRRQVATGGVTH